MVLFLTCPCLFLYTSTINNIFTQVVNVKKRSSCQWFLLGFSWCDVYLGVRARRCMCLISLEVTDFHMFCGCGSWLSDVFPPRSPPRWYSRDACGDTASRYWVSWCCVYNLFPCTEPRNMHVFMFAHSPPSLLMTATQLRNTSVLARIQGLMRE